ncbi:uncharacterized protein E0L32_009633 [Thyridium curvatum]|uniref:aromatic-amino-acid transaminase n=1 Tax=Thyridium curvatum TaxID=1093900 RepID=A0A507AVF8_9PEZI|nr:uncharacterized protein E0L32_009633 [Thyridium curvatum]TPX08929.1 hypothetical protein E0L32_009633 [Thyridium curvatum]
MVRSAASRTLRAFAAAPEQGRLRCRAAPSSRRSLQTSAHRHAVALASKARHPDADPAEEEEEPAKPSSSSSSSSSRSVTVQDVLERRARAGRLVAGTAAYSDSDMFKAPPHPSKPRAARWDHHLSAESAAREPCVLKSAAAKHLGRPGLISLGGGLPCPEYFPFESISMRVPRAPLFSERETAESGVDVTIGKYDASAAGGEDKVYDLSIGLNYGQATGSAQMLRFVTEHTEIVHDPPYADWRSCMTVGSTGALEQAFRMLCDRERGDSILTEEFSFSTALETAAPLGARIVGVPVDEEGLVPARMDEILTGWRPEERGGMRKPHVLYTVPSGQNPTGTTQGEQRRREVYDVCCKHDVYIIEDEPYYFLQMDPYAGPEAAAGGGKEPATTTAAPVDPAQTPVDEFLDRLIPSLLSMDRDGRVLRLDSFSKVVVPGSRLGWVTASEQMVERFLRHAEVANQGPAGFSQLVLHRLLDEEWGHEGYLRWLMRMRREYTARRDVMLAACDEALPREVVSWNAPAAGMFHWLKVDHTQHPDAGSKSIVEIEEDIFDRCIDKGVLVARGSWFVAEHGRPPTNLFFRATYAAAQPDKMTEAIRRFGKAVRESFRL